jgi:hypothetical protein
MLTASQLGEYIDAHLTRSAFRLELLDAYAVDSDGGDFDRYVRGEPGPTMERKRPWLDRLRRERDAGILNQRVHVLTTPLTQYLRYECEWGYRPNVEAGEDIRIIDLAEQTPPADLPDHDFWLVDDRYGVRMLYDLRGQFLGAEITDGLVPDYRFAKMAALDAGESFQEWWSRHPEEWRDREAA